jgi:hypothetical protein
VGKAARPEREFQPELARVHITNDRRAARFGATAWPEWRVRARARAQPSQRALDAALASRVTTRWYRCRDSSGARRRLGETKHTFARRAPHLLVGPASSPRDCLHFRRARILSEQRGAGLDPGAARFDPGAPLYVEWHLEFRIGKIRDELGNNERAAAAVAQEEEEEEEDKNTKITRPADLSGVRILPTSAAADGETSAGRGRPESD